MRVRGAATRCRRYSPVLLLGLLGCSDCSEPWPDEPGPITYGYLTVVPGELDIHVADATNAVKANLIAFVQDEYGRNIDDRTTRFTVTSGGAVLSVAPIGSRADQVVLTVAAVCDGNACAPAPIDGVVTAEHAASGRSIAIPIHVRYDKGGVDGVGVTLADATPMVGVASGRVAGTWRSAMLRPFIRRAGFVKFDAGVVTTPESDVPAGTVLSTRHAVWRRTQSWGTTPSDVSVPNTTPNSVIRLKARYAADPATFSANLNGFLIGVQGGADIVSYTPIGARAMLEGPVKDVTPVPWTDDCSAFGDALADKLADPADRPVKDVITIYMVPFTTGAAIRAAHCGPGKLGSTAAFAEAHVIVVPEGHLDAATVAHEIGHALSLGHVTFGSGFHDDNLMVLTDDLSAPMRFRLSIGQAWRAALHPTSYLVTALQAKSASIDCVVQSVRCPNITADIHGRVP